MKFEMESPRDSVSNQSEKSCHELRTERSASSSPILNVDSEHEKYYSKVDIILVKSLTLDEPNLDDSATSILIIFDESVPETLINSSNLESDDNLREIHLTNSNSSSLTLERPRLTLICLVESGQLRVIPFSMNSTTESHQTPIDVTNSERILKFEEKLVTLFRSFINCELVGDIVIGNSDTQFFNHSCFICLEKFFTPDECITHANRFHDCNCEYHQQTQFLTVIKLEDLGCQVLLMRKLLDSNRIYKLADDQTSSDSMVELESSVKVEIDSQTAHPEYSPTGRGGSLPLLSQLPYSAYLSAGGSLPTPLGMSSMNPNQMSFLLNLAAQSQQHAAAVAAASSKLVTMGDKSSLPSFIKGVGFEERSLPQTPVVSTPAGHCARNSNKTIKCPHCNWHYKYQETLEIHMRDKHPEFSSTVVGGNAANLQSTAASQCYYCQSKQQHPRLSRGETYSCGYKPYRCEVCNYSTTTKGNLSIHIQSDKHINNMHEHNQNLTLNANPSARMDLTTINSTTSSGPVALPPTKISTHQDLLTSKLPSGSSFSLCDTEAVDKLNPTGDVNDSTLSTNQPDMQELMLNAMNAAMRCWQVPNPLSDAPPNVSGASGVSANACQTMMSHGGSQQQHYTSNVFLCNVCLEFSSNSLEEMHNHITMQRSGRSDLQDDTMLYLEGYWHCRLCAYKSNLKANFQLHCKTDKHLQRQQLLNHVREGGAQNELRFSTLSTASPVQVRCNACNFFTTSAHKLRLHSVQPKHELCAALFHFLSEKEKCLLDATNSSVLVFECLLCRVMYSSKLELMQHLQTEQHERAYTTEQFQYQSQNQLMELHSIVTVSLTSSDSANPIENLSQNSSDNIKSTGPGSEMCPLCKHSNLPNGLNLRQHMEKEHKIPPDFVEKFLKMAQMDQTCPSNRQDATIKALAHQETDSDKENDFFRVTQETDDVSANAYLLSETKCKALEEDCLRCQHCVSTFSNIDDFYKHQSETGHGETPSSSGFLCFKKGCNQYFQSIEYLKLHFHEIHAKSADVTSHKNFPHICKLCNLLAFPSENTLSEHMEMHTKLSSVTHACAHCEWLVPSAVTEIHTARGLLRQHLIDGHHVMRPKKLVELERDRTTPEANQRAPSLSALSPSGFSCPLQPDEAMSTTTHDSFMDPNRKFKCFACRIGFEKQIQLAAHTRSHSHKRLSMDSVSMDTQSVSNTTRFHETSRKLKCETCVESFSTRQQLYAHNNSAQHMKSLKEEQEENSSDDKLFKCNVCDVSFKEKSDFDSHSMSVEHLTYMANISRLIQEGRLQQNNLESSSLNHSTNDSQSSTSGGNSSAQTSLNSVYPLNLLAMQYAAANSSKSLSLTPGFSPLLPVGVNPSLLPQFLHNMFYRFPFQNSSLPYFPNPLQLPPQPPLYPPMTSAPGMICPVCGVFVSGLEAMSQHPCFRSATKTGETADNSNFQFDESKHPATTRSVKEEDSNSNDSVDREIQRPLLICTESGSDSSRPLSTDSANMNSLKSSLNEPHTLNPTSTAHSKPLNSISTANKPGSASVLPSPGLSIPFFSAPASTNATTSMATLNYAATSLSLPSQVTSIYSSVTAATSTDNAKRGRTRINEEQLKILRSFFDISNSPSDAKIQEMSQLTGLQCRVIKHWFRNTLFKERQRNKNSPYNFSVPPSTSLNLEEYEKTGRVEIKNEQDDDDDDDDDDICDSKDIDDVSMDLDQNKNLKESHDRGSSSEALTDKKVKSERTASPSSSASSISFSDTATSEVVKSNVFKRKREEDDEETPSGKRIRTTITPEQQDILLTYYQKDPNPSRKQMDVIAQQVDLSKRVVQVWFQNTRSRDRKGLLRNAGSQVLPISKRCPFCHVLFKVRNALEVHLLQCHSNKWSPNSYPLETIPNESEPDQMKSVEMSQVDSKLDDSNVSDIPLDLSNRNSTGGSMIGRQEEMDDSQTIYWDDDSQECNVSGSDAGTKRNRTSISSSQLKVMKAVLVHYKTPTNQECDLLGTYIGLTRRVVQVWFQNQRAKEKKHMREINHLEHMGSGSGTPSGKKRSQGKSYLVGDSDHPTGCELCEVFFDGTDTASVQEHVLSASHLQRLVHRIHNDEKSDCNNGQKPLDNQISDVSKFASSVTAPGWIMPSQFALNVSTK